MMSIRQQSVREMFDDISLNVIAFLEVFALGALSCIIYQWPGADASYEMIGLQNRTIVLFRK